MHLDPAYVQALTQVNNAEAARKRRIWRSSCPPSTRRRATPALDAAVQPRDRVSRHRPARAASLDARYELFNGGRNIAEAKRSADGLEAARAGEVGARFMIAAQVERAYYDVLGARELLEVGSTAPGPGAGATGDRSGSRGERRHGPVRFAAGPARSAARRDRSRAAQADLVRSASSNSGAGPAAIGGADAAPLDTLPPPPLSLTLEEAFQYAATQGPAWVQARANESAAAASTACAARQLLSNGRAHRVPRKFDSKFFPSLTTRRTVGFTISLPIWDGAQRELALARCDPTAPWQRPPREPRAIDRHDVTQAYTGYASLALARQ